MRGVGFYLGLTIGAFILFGIISYIFFRPKNVSDLEIKKYVGNTNSLIIEQIPLITVFSTPQQDERLGGDITSKITFFSNRNMTYKRAVTYSFYCSKLNKYVKTFLISEAGGLDNELTIFGKAGKDKTIWPDMIFYYNKTQNADPTFGTIDKPLPILHFRSSDPALRSMRQNNKDADPAYLKKVYEENVKLYLEYFIEKEDFKKLFPDS